MATLIGQRLEPTFALATLTILIAIVVAVPLGALAAWRFGGWLDRALMGFSVLGFSVPVFVLGVPPHLAGVCSSSAGCRCRATCASRKILSYL